MLCFGKLFESNESEEKFDVNLEISWQWRAQAIFYASVDAGVADTSRWLIALVKKVAQILL